MTIKDELARINIEDRFIYEVHALLEKQQRFQFYSVQDITVNIICASIDGIYHPMMYVRFLYNGIAYIVWWKSGESLQNMHIEKELEFTVNTWYQQLLS